MEFNLDSIPIWNLTLEETSHLKAIPGAGEAVKLRSKITKAYNSLKQKLSKVGSRDSNILFGQGVPPIREMLGVLAYVETYGYTPMGSTSPHLVPFLHLLKYQDNEFAVISTFPFQIKDLIFRIRA